MARGGAALHDGGATAGRRCAPPRAASDVGRRRVPIAAAACAPPLVKRTMSPNLENSARMFGNDLAFRFKNEMLKYDTFLARYKKDVSQDNIIRHVLRGDLTTITGLYLQYW